MLLTFFRGPSCPFAVEFICQMTKNNQERHRKRGKKQSLSPSLIPMHIVQTKIELFPITSIQNEWLGKTVHNFNGIILCARFLFCVSSNFSKQMKIGSEVDAKNQNVLF